MRHVVRLGGAGGWCPTDINLEAIVAVRYYEEPKPHVELYFNGREKPVCLREEQSRQFLLAWVAYLGGGEDEGGADEEMIVRDMRTLAPDASPEQARWYDSPEARAAWERVVNGTEEATDEQG